MSNAVMTEDNDCNLNPYTLSPKEFEDGLEPGVVAEIQEETKDMGDVMREWFNGNEVF